MKPLAGATVSQIVNRHAAVLPYVNHIRLPPYHLLRHDGELALGHVKHHADANESYIVKYGGVALLIPRGKSFLRKTVFPLGMNHWFRHLEV